MDIATIDIIVFVSYCVLILAIGLYVSRNKDGKKKTAEDYLEKGCESSEVDNMCCDCFKKTQLDRKKKMKK